MIKQINDGVSPDLSSALKKYHIRALEKSTHSWQCPNEGKGQKIESPLRTLTWSMLKDAQKPKVIMDMRSQAHARSGLNIYQQEMYLFRARKVYELTAFCLQADVLKVSGSYNTLLQCYGQAKTDIEDWSPI